MAKETQAGSETVTPLPYEVGGSDERTPEESLFDLLASDPDFGDETPGGSTEDEDESESEEDLDDEDSDDEPTPEDDEGDEDLEDDEDFDDEDDEEDDDARFEVTLPGGKKEKVTLDELRRGYSRTQDYTRKTQELANERKAIEAAKAEAAAARDEYGILLGQVRKFLETSGPKEPDWDKLRRENPAEYAALREEFRQQKEDLAAVAAEEQRLLAERQQDQEAQYREYLKGEQEKLLEALPKWKDQKVAKQEKAAILAFAKGLGYSEEELGAVADHRVVLILRDAMRYRKLSEKKGTVREKTKRAKVLRSGGRVDAPRKGPKAEAKRARERLARSGREKDAAAVILGMIDD